MSGAAPRFSVIIAVYNGATTLARAIDSVLHQTYPPHELIVIDDGSRDDTANVARAYGERVRYMYQANAGVAAARNVGAQAACGDWLAFLDADDWYYPERLRCHAEWLKEDVDLDFLTGDYDYVTSDGGRISGSMETHESGRNLLAKAAGASRIIMPTDDLESFVADHFGDTHTLSVPRRTFLALGGYPAGYKVCEDVFLLTKLCAASRRIGVVCAPLAAYVIHEGSATRKDPLAAQIENVRTLVALNTAASHFTSPVRHGVRMRLRSARLNLGYALVRNGRRAAALRAVAPTLIESPGLKGVGDMLSMLI